MADSNHLSNEQLLKELEKRAADAEERLSVLEKGETKPGAMRSAC